MNAKKIQELIEIVEQSNIGELEISRWGTKVRISKVPRQGATESMLSAPVVSSPQPTVSVQLPSPPAPVAHPPVQTAVEASVHKKLIEIKAPIVGTFYRAPAPDADPYVKVGDQIAIGQVLCIIEAMKLMNEIEAECTGRIVEVKMENGKPVEYNQVLFLVDPGA